MNRGKSRRPSKNKSYYQTQFSYTSLNKTRKLKKHFKHNENDLVAKKKLISLGEIIT
jgi:hypothetical protein